MITLRMINNTLFRHSTENVFKRARIGSATNFMALFIAKDKIAKTKVVEKKTVQFIADIGGIFVNKYGRNTARGLAVMLFC